MRQPLNWLQWECPANALFPKLIQSSMAISILHPLASLKRYPDLANGAWYATSWNKMSIVTQQMAGWTLKTTQPSSTQWTWWLTTWVCLDNTGIYHDWLLWLDLRWQDLSPHLNLLVPALNLMLFKLHHLTCLDKDSTWLAIVPHSDVFMSLDLLDCFLPAQNTSCHSQHGQGVQKLTHHPHAQEISHGLLVQ